jgi:signal transduction histidine kinase
LVLKNQITMLERSLPADREDLLGRTRQMAAVSQTAIEGARALAYSLRPVELDRAGLSRSIQAMLDRAAASSEIQFDPHIENVDGMLSPASEGMVYRITQELVNNVLKHSRAGRVTFDLENETGRIRLCVADNGVGFDADEVRHHDSAHGGLGLESIRERVEMLSGTWEIQSTPGEGTRVTISIPRI